MKKITLFAFMAIMACSGQKKIDKSSANDSTLAETRKTEVDDNKCPPPMPAPVGDVDELNLDVIDYYMKGYCLHLIVGYSGCGKVDVQTVQDPSSPQQITFWSGDPGMCDAYFQDTLKLNLPDKSRSVYYKTKEIRP